MPPFLATCLTLTFILWLFYRDVKRGYHASMGVWLAVIWVGTLASRPIGLWFGGEAGAGRGLSAEEGSPIDRNILLVLIISALFVLMRRGINWGLAMRSNRWLWLFYVYLLVSVLWSDYPFIAFKRWFREFGNLVMILVILTEENPEVAVKQVFMRCAYVLIPLSVLFIKYYPDLGRYYNQWTGEATFGGVTTDKNELGRLAMLSGFFMLWSLVVQQRSGWLKWIKEGLPELLILAMCVWILHIANSQTSLGCFAIGIAVLFGSRVSWIQTKPGRLARSGWALIMVSFLFFYFPDLRQIVTSHMGRNVNLTERTDVWAGALAVGTNPLIGTGFASFWLTSGGRALGERLTVCEAHNGFLETYLNSGLIGVGLLLAVLLAAGKSILRQFVAGRATASLFATLFLSGVIYNYTEADVNTNSIIGFVLWMVAMQYQPHRCDENNTVIHELRVASQTRTYASSRLKSDAGEATQV